jgi:uncharacterized membrane protein YczE
VRTIATGRFDRPVERSVRLLSGLVLFGLAMALLLEAHAGLDPWNVFHQGITRHVDLTIGQVTIISSLVLLAAWVPLRQRPGLGTVSNVVVIAVSVDAMLAVLPEAGSSAVGLAMLLAGVALGGVASGAYIGAGLGPGPRDGLMTGLVGRTGRSIRLVRTSLELTVLAAGAALGGTVGLGTVVYALSIGPLIGVMLPRLTVPLPPAPAPAAS